MGSRNATREDFDRVRALMASGRLRADIMLNQEFAFSALAETFEPQVINNRELIKGVIYFDR